MEYGIASGYYGDTNTVINDINYLQGGSNSGVNLTLRYSPDGQSTLSTFAQVAAATGDKFDLYEKEAVKLHGQILCL